MQSAACAAVLLAACASPPLPPTGAPTPLDLAAFEGFDPSGFPGAAKLLQGFAPPEDAKDFRVGDAALLGLVVDDGSTQVRRLLLLELRDLMVEDFVLDGDTRVRGKIRRRHRASIQLTRNPQSGGGESRGLESYDVELSPLQIRLSLHDEHGVELSTSSAILYEELLLGGFWPIARKSYESKDGAMPMLLLMTLQRLGGDDAVMQELLFSVVQKPSIFSVLMKFGIHVVAAAQQGCEGPEVLLGDRTVRCNVLPVDLDVNGSRALSVHVFCTQPALPDAIVAGVVGAVARHPSEPRFAAIRLIGTRRGPPKPR